MTDIATEPVPATVPDTWSRQLLQLRERYRHVRQPILVALNLMLSNENISLDDAKAQAHLRGSRITAASMNAARTLLSRMDAPTSAPAAQPPVRTSRATPDVVAKVPAPAPRARPRVRNAEPLDVETAVRGFVAKLQTERDAEADRLREAIRRAVAVLQAAIG